MTIFGIVISAVVVLLASQSIGSSAQDENGYRLGAGDVVSISILAGGTEQVVTDMVVGDGGDVTVPFIGKIQAAGMSVSELEKKILLPLTRDFS